MNIFKVIFTVTLLFTIIANSQLTKNNWLVGGNGNFSSYKSQSSNNGTEVINKGFAINLSPTIGYFILDRLVTGANINIGSTMPKDFDNTFSYGIGPFARYYFLDNEKLINIFFQGNYIFGASKSGENNSRSNGYGFKAGPAIFFNSSVALEVTLDYNSAKLIPDGLESSSYKNLQIGLGFQIHLEK